MTATRRITLVWLALLALTFASFLVGVDQDSRLERMAAIVIVGVSLFKVHLIGVHFMDLRVAPRVLRLVFDGYLLTVFAVLTIIDLTIF